MAKLTLESGNSTIVKTIEGETWTEICKEFFFALQGAGFIISDPEELSEFCSIKNSELFLKNTTIFNEDTHNSTEEIEVDISDEIFLIVAKLAQEKNITFDEEVNNILREAMKEHEKDEHI